MEKTKTATYAVAQINKVDILIIENGEKMIAVKPICEALGINSNGQIERIKSDSILSSVNKICLSTGKDKKQYEMFCIPFKYVFGWLFTIDDDKVKPEAREAVIKYKMACYDALYAYFTGYADFVKQWQSNVDGQLDIVDNLKKDFSQAKGKLAEAEERLKILRKFSYQDYQAENMQIKIEFPVIT